MTDEAQQLAPLPATETQVMLSNPFDMTPELFRQSLERRQENRKTMIEWIKGALVDGVDWGRIHIAKNCPHKENKTLDQCKNESHWSKPVMYKPGAEKVCGMLGVTPRYPRLADYEQAAIDGKKLENIILRCELYNSAGVKVAEGVGARNLAKDYHDLNKAMKMAEKSGHVDATLRMGGLSEVFTQDGDAIGQEDDDETITHEHHLTFFNLLKDSGLFDSEEKIQRQLANLARAVGKKSLTEIPLSMFETCKAQLESGVQALRAQRAKKAQTPATEQPPLQE